MEEKVYPKNITVYNSGYIKLKQLHAYLKNKYGKRIKMKTIFEKMVHDAWDNKEKLEF